jgi:hypothetical protein
MNLSSLTFDFSLFSLFNDNEADLNLGQSGPDPSEDGPDSDPNQGGSDPGKDDSDPGKDGSDPGKDDSDPDDKSSGKGKGKAKVTTPEEIKEWYTDLDEQCEQDDIEKAKSNSLKEPKKGESSKQGENLEYLEYIEEQRKYDEYRYNQKARKEAMRGFNDVLDKINKEGDSMDQRDKEYLLNESIKIREAFDYYSNNAQNLKNELNINSSEEESSEQNSSGECWSEDSSDEESRPSKRTRK